MDIYDMLIGGGDPMQQMMAQVRSLRSRQDLNTAMQQAGQQSNQYDMLSAAAHMAGNNPGLAQGADIIQKSMALRAHPQALGQSGVVVGNQYFENPEYSENKDADRQQRLLSAAALLSARRENMDTRTQLFQQAEEGRMDRAAQANALRQTIAAMHGATAGQNAASRQEFQQQMLEQRQQQQNEQTNQRMVAQYGNKLTSEGIPEFAKIMDNVNGILQQYKPGSLPGYGRLEGYLPTQILPAEAQNVRSTIQQAANVILKLRSGAAVTDQEYKRFLNEAATGGGFSEQTLRKYWPRMQQSFQEKANGLASGYSPQVLDTYVQQGGRDFRAPQKPMSDDDLIKKYLK